MIITAAIITGLLHKRFSKIPQKTRQLLKENQIITVPGEGKELQYNLITL